MISGKVATLIFLLNRSWPLQLIKNGVAARLVTETILEMSPDELKETISELKNYGWFGKNADAGEGAII